MIKKNLTVCLSLNIIYVITDYVIFLKLSGLSHDTPAWLCVAPCGHSFPPGDVKIYCRLIVFGSLPSPWMPALGVGTFCR